MGRRHLGESCSFPSHPVSAFGSCETNPRTFGTAPKGGIGLTTHLLSLSQEILDRPVDVVLALYLRRHQVLCRIETLVQLPQKLTAAVCAFHLAVAKEVYLGQQLLLQQRDAFVGVASRPVVTVREVEPVDV